jgi:hypothetical protein
MFVVQAARDFAGNRAFTGTRRAVDGNNQSTRRHIASISDALGSDARSTSSIAAFSLRLSTADCRLPTVDCRLSTADLKVHPR